MDGKLQRIIQLWQTDQKNHSPVPGVHLKVEQDLQVVKDSIFDIVRFIDDDNWCLPLIQGKAVDLLLDDVKVFSLPVGWLCAQGCGEIPVEIIHCKSGVPYDIEQEQTGKQDKESAGPDCATICRPQDFFLNMSRTKRKRKLVEWLESCQENQVSVLDEKIPLLSFAVDFVTAYEYQKARGIKIHPGLWKDMRVDIFLVKKEN